MIKYNLRYRGPFEYDKFILSIFQFSNEVKLLQESVINGDLALLKADHDKTKKILDQLTGEKGIMQKLLALNLLRTG